MRQLHDLLAVEFEMLFWDHYRIGEDVIDIGCAHGPREAQVVDLDGGGTQGKDAGAAVLGETLEIDGDVDLMLPCQGGDVLVAVIGHIEKAVEGFDQSRPHIVLPVGAEGKGEDLEAATVVSLE